MVVKKCPDCDQTLPVACKSCPCGHVFISKKQLHVPQQDKPDTGEGNHRDQRLRPEIPKLSNKDFDYDYGAKMEREHEEVQTTSHEQIQTPGPIANRILVSESSLSETQHLVIRNYQAVVPVGGAITQSMHMIPAHEPPSLVDEYSNSKRKRGRPKGSKNKPKPILQPGEEPHPSIHDDSPANGQNTESADAAKRKRGRPKGSKNKPKDPTLLKGKSSSSNQCKDDWSSDQQDSTDYCQEPYVDIVPHVSKEKAISYSIVLSDINQKMMKQSSMNFV